jgi:hypothetical protein
VVVIRRGKLQQLREGCCSGLMHGGTDRRFDGFQVEAADFAAPGEHSLQQLFYFARDFLVDSRGRFFPLVTETPLPGVPGRSFH